MPKPKDFYTSRYLYLQGKVVRLSHHAIRRAERREIYPDMILATINGGRIARFGKNFLRFTKKYKLGEVICVGEDLGEVILVKTIEWGKRR